MNDLERYIRDSIRKNGPMPVDVFMGLALGHPVYGYYMTRDPLGAQGDFTTAPEISQLFGEMIGAWIADVWSKLGRPEQITILECGPGRGTLMADAMRITRPVPGFHDALTLHLLETSPVLKKKQADLLTPYTPHWHETLQTVPRTAPVILIANEFLDALPIRQHVKTASGLKERMVTLDAQDRLCFTPAGTDIQETSPARDQFIRDVAALLNETTGAALFIDYGHVQTGPGDTLQAVYKHKPSDVLAHIGDADLTAHVDFEALQSAAAGLCVHGPVTQAQFLSALGIQDRAAVLSRAADDKQKDDLHAALHRLIAPDQMGTLFKVIGLTHDPTLPLAGFSI